MPKQAIALLLAGLLIFGACGQSALSETGGGSTQVADDVRPEPANPDEDPAGFTVVGATATMSGVIDSDFDRVVRELLATHVALDRIVMTNVPGSSDDDANLRASLLIHEAGVTTELLSDSEIASGGVDFFLAGTVRIVAAGARIGVHSWAGGETAGSDLPREDQEHRKYLDYYAAIGIDSDFYWFTLDAAKPEDIHWMTSAEIERYTVATTS